MQFGLSLPQYDFSLPDGNPSSPISLPKLIEFAQAAERLGFDSVWVSDHFFYSLGRYGGDDRPLGAIEPLTALAALAVRTERIRLGSLVLCSGFRHPAVLAKMATAVDLLSAGRLDLGIGAGWYRREYEAFGYGFGTTGERFEILEETMQVLGLLFEEGPGDFQGRRFSLQGAYNHPLPLQKGGPPVWLGAKGGNRALRLAARHAAGWNTVWRWTPEAYGERVGEARLVCQEVGRDPDSLRLSVGLYTIVGEDGADLDSRFERFRRWIPGVVGDETREHFAVDTLTGTPDRVLERIGRFAALGVEEIIIAPAPLPFAVPDPSMLELIAGSIVGPGHDI